MTWRTSLIQTNLLCNAPGLVGDESIWLQCATKYYLQSTLNKRVIRSYWAWIPDVILFESKTISLSFELWVSLGILRPAPSMLTFFALGAGLGIPSEPHSSKLRLIVLLSNRMTSGINALCKIKQTIIFQKYLLLLMSASIITQLYLDPSHKGPNCLSWLPK